MTIICHPCSVIAVAGDTSHIGDDSVLESIFDRMTEHGLFTVDIDDDHGFAQCDICDEYHTNTYSMIEA